MDLRSEVMLIIGGPQGAGLETAMAILGYAFARLGYGVLADREYFSNIKGRHSYVHIAVSSRRIPASLDYPVDLVAAMDAETVFTHYGDIADGGFLVYDSSTEDRTFDSIPSIESDLKEWLSKAFRELGLDGSVKSLVRYLSEARRIRAVGFRYSEVLNEAALRFRLPPQQLSRYLSSIVVGSVVALLGLNLKAVEYAFSRRFKGRRDVVETNMAIVESVLKRVSSVGGSLSLEKPSTGLKELMVVSGNDIVAMGKIVGGLGYQAYYPITPAADESLLLEGFENLEAGGKKFGSLIVLQTEDEISAINSAIGAALVGARASTSTSGPGFDLMVEGLSWAGMNEVPVVITYYQRGGPSTGLPTRGAQSDLLYAVFAGHGEFPKVVIASGDHGEAFYDAIEAFNIAERYQLPVIHLLDKFLANSIKTVPVPDISRVRIDRGNIVEGGEGYKRFDKRFPISPRALIGRGAVMWYTGDEHDEYGHIDEDPINRLEMYSKRMKKLEIVDSEIPEERRFTYHGDPDPDVLLIGWGFVKGAAVEAVEVLSKRGIRAAYVNLRMIHPFPKKSIKKLIEGLDAGRVIAVEHSYIVQVADLIAMNTGIVVEKRIAKFTGRPIYRFEIVKAVEDILSRGISKVVLSYGA